MVNQLLVHKTTRLKKKDLISFLGPSIDSKYKPSYQSGPHEEDLRIFINVGADDYQDALDLISSKLKQRAGKIKILLPDKRFSQKYNTIQFFFKKNIYHLVFAWSKVLSGGMDADVKEGITGILWLTNIIEPATIENAKKIYKQLKETKYTSDLLRIDRITISKTQTYLNSVVVNKKSLRALNDKISVVKILYEAGYTPDNYIFERGGIFNRIKEVCAGYSNLPRDKWCPADAFLIKRDHENDIKFIIETKRLKEINKLFVPKWGSHREPILAISLKELVAQGGKAMSYLKRFVEVHGNTYYVTPADQTLTDRQRLLKINQVKKKLTGFIAKHKGIIEYQFEESNKEPASLKDKYTVYKVLNYLLDLNNPKIFEELAMYSMGLGIDNINPPFFKLMGHHNGSSAVVTPFIKPDEVKRIGKILVLDRESFAGIRFRIMFNISKHAKKVQLAIRVYGRTQATIEIERAF